MLNSICDLPVGCSSSYMQVDLYKRCCLFEAQTFIHLNKCTVQWCTAQESTKKLTVALTASLPETMISFDSNTVTYLQIRLTKLLGVKKKIIQEVKDMNTEAEKMVFILLYLDAFNDFWWCCAHFYFTICGLATVRRLSSTLWWRRFVCL